MADNSGSSIEEQARAAVAEGRTVDEAVRSIVAAAQAAQAKGRRLTAAKKALRDALIVQRVAEGWSWAMIADEAGIKPRQCTRIAEEYRQHGSPLDVAPTQLVEELAVGYRQSVATFTALAAGADNTAAAVGALKGANDAREKMVALLQAVGHVPHDLGTLKLQRDVQQVALRMFEAMDAFARGELDRADVVAVFEEVAGIAPPRELPGGDVD